MLLQLLQWVGEYEVRDDEYGLKRHRRIFDGFSGPKKEYLSVAAYAEDPGWGHRSPGTRSPR